MRPLNIFYVGNFDAPHSTENHLRSALEHNGHRVIQHLERPENWAPAAAHLKEAHAEWGIDFALWTSTSGYAPRGTFEQQQEYLVMASQLDIPTVGYHLDVWWGLKREHEVREKPFWRQNVLCTADGGHQEQWWRQGVQHYWFPPGIVDYEARVGTFREEYASDVCFVGQGHGYGHKESSHRFLLVDHLRDWAAAHPEWRVRFWPGDGKPRIDSVQLRDLYASSKVVIGDSCMVPRFKRYWSDRIPNVTGRGAFLLHPEVVGLKDQHPDLITWPAGDWERLDEKIAYFLEDENQRVTTARDCMADTLEHHTYEVRMKQLVTLLTQKGLL